MPSTGTRTPPGPRARSARATDESLQVKLIHPVTTDHITLLQPQTGPRNRTVTDVTLTFDGGPPVDVHARRRLARRLRARWSRSPRRTFRTLTVTIDGTSAGIQKSYQSQSAVGFAEVTIPGVPPATESPASPDRPARRDRDVVAATTSSTS